MYEVRGSIDISPPLAWSEVKPTGYAVMDGTGVPQPPVGQWLRLVPTEILVDRPEGTLHAFRFGSIEAVQAEVLEADRETLRAQLAAIVAAFPTHTFGGSSRIIRFRGDLLDDQWRVGVDIDGITVRRQNAGLTWTDA